MLARSGLAGTRQDDPLRQVLLKCEISLAEGPFAHHSGMGGVQIWLVRDCQSKIGASLNAPTSVTPMHTPKAKNVI